VSVYKVRKEEHYNNSVSKEKMEKINQNSSPAFSYKEKGLKQATLQLFKSPSLERERFRVSFLASIHTLCYFF